MQAALNRALWRERWEHQFSSVHAIRVNRGWEVAFGENDRGRNGSADEVRYSLFHSHDKFAPEPVTSQPGRHFGQVGTLRTLRDLAAESESGVDKL